MKAVFFAIIMALGLSADFGTLNTNIFNALNQTLSNPGFFKNLIEYEYEHYIFTRGLKYLCGGEGILGFDSQQGHG